MDANVLLAASISPEGRSAALFDLASRSRCTLLASPHVVHEARRNLEARYPRALQRFEKLMGAVELVPEAHPSDVVRAQARGLPAEDAPVLAAAVLARVDILTTGDRTHFGHLFGKMVEGVRVSSLADALGKVLT